VSTAPRYSLGIDLGTTHCALAWVDLQATDASDGDQTTHGVLSVPQVTAPGTVESRDLLPSFLYLPHADELAAGDLSLPWGEEQGGSVGTMARQRGATTPIRLVSSARAGCATRAWTGAARSCPPTRLLKSPACRRWRHRGAIWHTCATLGTTRIPRRRSTRRPSP